MKTFKGLGFWACPLSWLYAIGVKCHRYFYHGGFIVRYQAPCPVISIGNIVVGGTGKTPMTVWLAQRIVSMGYKVGIVLRGYKAKAGKSDEGLMLQELLPDIPIAINPRRDKAIQALLSSRTLDVILCDDAFQHWPLKRELDIVLLDAYRAFGNGCLLPAGILRESPKALQRAQVVVITKSDDDKPYLALAQHVRSINPKVLLVRARHHIISIRDLRTNQEQSISPQQAVLGVCAIADPDSFFRLAIVHGFNIVKQDARGDHYFFTQDDIEIWEREARLNDVKTVILTHKDAVKVKSLDLQNTFLQFWVIHLEMHIIEGEKELLQCVRELNAA